jgi:hypothetical protein
MEQGFRILIHRNDDRLHVKMIGYFDESAARKLVGLLESYANKFSIVFLHTNGLQSPVPSSLEACRRTLRRVNWKSTRLVATGTYGDTLVPGPASIRIEGPFQGAQTRAATG